jgi:hypothetical protein
MPLKIKEHMCPACNGTGFPEVKQPPQTWSKNLSGPVQSLRW